MQSNDTSATRTEINDTSATHEINDASATHEINDTSATHEINDTSATHEINDASATHDIGDDDSVPPGFASDYTDGRNGSPRPATHLYWPGCRFAA